MLLMDITDSILILYRIKTIEGDIINEWAQSPGYHHNMQITKEKFEFELSQYFDDYDYWLLASTGLVAVVSGC